MEEYLECHGTQMFIKEITPEIDFLFQIFGDDFRTENGVLCNIDFIIKRMTDTLHEKNKNIIKAMYGLPKDELSTGSDPQPKTV